MSKKPIVFIGAERVGKATLKNLLDAGKNIVAVFTAAPNLKSKIADYVDFLDIKQRYPRVNFHYIKNSSHNSVVRMIRSYKPEVIFVVSWSYIIPAEVLKIPSMGVIGLHYSLLPERRGAAPLNWAIIDGLKKMGVTLFYMDTGIDTGDVIAQRKFSIGQEDTVNDLLEKITRIAPRLVLKYFDMIVEGRAPRVRQNNLKSSHTPRRRPKDSEINWLWDVKKIHRFIRALTYPYPSAFFQIRNKKITLISGKLMKNKKIMIEGYIEENGKRKE